MANFGETLKQARAHKGVTLKEAEQATRINRNHLAALEDENFAALPPLIYQRGIVRNYAMYLGLDASRILSFFEDARGGEDPRVGSGGVAAVPPVNMPTHWAPNFAIIAFSVVLSAIVFAWVYSAFVQAPTEESTPTEVVATVTPFASDVALPTEPPPSPTPSPAPEVSPTLTSERVETGRPVPTGEDGGGDNQLIQNDAEAEVGASSDEAETEAASDPAEPVQQEGAFVTSLSVTAVDSITLAVVADGVPVYEGTLDAGASTGFLDGSVFEVFTSSGENTMFTNTCSDVPFNMGYQQGEAYYILEADGESCGLAED